jgi:hypothetical protein
MFSPSERRFVATSHAIATQLGPVVPPHIVIRVSTTTPLHSVALTTAFSALCPDGLRYEQMGEADGWRGRVVRVFFWLLRAWPVR